MSGSGHAFNLRRESAEQNRRSMIRRWISVQAPISPSVVFHPPQKERPFPLEDPRCRLFHRARHGLWEAVRAYGFEAGQEVLVPSYHHGSEIEALIRAGLRPRFYACDERLEPDPSHLEDLLNPRVRVLYLIHYLGFPQDGARWRRWADEHDLLLIEDAAQAWLSARDGRPVGSHGDIALFCLYKTLGLSDGGAVISSLPWTSLTGVSTRGLRALGAGMVGWLSQRVSVSGTFGRSLHTPFDPECDSIDLGDPVSSPSRAASFVVDREADLAIAEKRRANYRALLSELADFVPPPFSQLPEGASPLQFPIQVRDKPAFLERLAGEGVEGANCWPLPHPVGESEQCDRVRALRSTLVGLPVHQELRERDLVRIAGAARSALASNGRPSIR